MKHLTFLIPFLFLISCETAQSPTVSVEGDLMQWHKVTLMIQGPATSETAPENPFLDYRLEAEFSQGDRSFVVPGYFAADGNAAETSALEGNVWKVHFRPDAPGNWEYRISFLGGKDIAVSDDPGFGEPVGPDGSTGSFEIAGSDKSGSDFRAKGRLVHGGKGYFRFNGTGDLWIKNGADSPENFLSYSDFDQTLRYGEKEIIREGEANPKEQIHRYEPHLTDWKEGDPTWQDGKGKGIIGAVNYLASAGVNSMYMLTMNILGDGKDVWPYTDHNERYRFDCSKLDQWEVVFRHMERNGIMLHFVLQETENECLLDIGQTGVQRRVYLRELVARYGHHLAVTWNMGEENGPMHWSPVGMTDAHRKAMATYLKSIHPYVSNVVVHTHSNNQAQEDVLVPLLGFEHLDGPSMQIGNPYRVHERVLRWVNASEEAGKRWLVNLDEIGPAWKGVMPDSHDADHDTVRHHCLWGTLLAGGGGVEWYFGYRYPHNDLGLEDFRSRANWWKQSTLATRFMEQFPVEEMECLDKLLETAGSPGGYCLAKPGQVYVAYLPQGWTSAQLDIEGGSPFEVSWFDPRGGGDLQKGSIREVEGSGMRNLGLPPSDPGKDWVVVVR